MRLFLASRLSLESRLLLSAETRELVRQSEGHLRSVPHASEHLTHVFLGATDVPAARLLSALAPIRQIPGLRITVGQARVFSSRGRPRLVCLDVLDHQAPLLALSEAVRDALVKVLPELSDYRLKPPHVTLARFGRRAGRPQARRVGTLLDESGLAQWRREETIDTVELIQSTLSHSGSTYDTVGEIRLRDTAGAPPGPSQGPAL